MCQHRCRLPGEIWEKILYQVDDLPSLVALTQSARVFRELTSKEAFWEQACLSAGFLRSNAFDDSSWRMLASAIAHHLGSCAICQEMYLLEEHVITHGQSALRFVANKAKLILGRSSGDSCISFES